MNNKLNLKQKILIISILCSFIPISVLGFISFLTIHDLLLEKEEAKLLSLGKHVEGLVNNYYANCGKDLSLLSNMEEAKMLFTDNSFYSTSNTLLHFALNNPVYKQLAFIDLEGKEVVKIINDGYPIIVPRKELQNIINSNDFEKIKVLKPYEESVIINEFKTDTYVGIWYRPNVRYATAVTDIFGNKKGYFILDVKAEPLLDELDDLQSKYPNIYLLDKKGVFFYHPESEFTEEDYLKVQNDFTFLIDNIKKAERYQTNITNDSIVASYPFEVNSLNKIGMIFIIKIERYQFLQPLNNFYAHYLSIGLALVIILTSLGIYFSNIVTKPLIKLSEAMDNVAVGDFSQQISVNSFTEEEIRSLIVHFNNMIEKINAHYAILEDKVEERTRELSKATEEMTRLAITDPLTGLYNRHFFQAYIMQQAETCKRYNQKLIIIVADVDNFKYINDCFGHNVGDKVLKILAELLNSSKRASDIVIRYGGDEFLLILMNDKEEAFLKWKARLAVSFAEWNKKIT